ARDNLSSIASLCEIGHSTEFPRPTEIAPPRSRGRAGRESVDTCSAGSLSASTRLLTVRRLFLLHVVAYQAPPAGSVHARPYSRAALSRQSRFDGHRAPPAHRGRARLHRPL